MLYGVAALSFMCAHWEIVADNLSKAGFNWGCSGQTGCTRICARIRPADAADLKLRFSSFQDLAQPIKCTVIPLEIVQIPRFHSLPERGAEYGHSSHRRSGFRSILVKTCRAGNHIGSARCSAGMFSCRLLRSFWPTCKTLLPNNCVTER
jgi:hypothetical protein